MDCKIALIPDSLLPGMQGHPDAVPTYLPLLSAQIYSPQAENPQAEHLDGIGQEGGILTSRPFIIIDSSPLFPSHPLFPNGRYVAQHIAEYHPPGAGFPFGRYRRMKEPISDEDGDYGGVTVVQGPAGQVGGHGEMFRLVCPASRGGSLTLRQGQAGGDER
jgi:hypothetical protein